jgi:UTP--glucose-1-phosphate uridylyltransferase
MPNTLQIQHFAALMRAEGLPPIVIATFEHYYAQLAAGATGLIAEADIEPVTDLPDADSFRGAYRAAGLAALPKTVLIKLNGGLGTGMGMTTAKTLLPVKNGLTFLDVIARQALHAGVPLVLMNSFATRDDTLAALRQYPALWHSPLELDFLQHKFPKVLQADLSPAPADPENGWNPPGHGDLYTALVTSGMLARMLAAGYEYAFVSNGDNLGAALDADLLGYFASHALPFMMEVAGRTEADRKGGHLARTKSGGLVLRESAQCPPQDEPAFQDLARHRYFNTNNLWVHLPSLKGVLESSRHILGLPLILNRKTLDPRDLSSPAVFHLETAMGSAISVFPGAQAVRVPRARFSPVKTTNDLLAVRSDAFVLTDDFRVSLRGAARPVVELDPQFYRLIDDFDARFPHGAPSLRDCAHLSVTGDVIFGRGVTIRGRVCLTNDAPAPLHLADGSLLEGT